MPLKDFSRDPFPRPLILGHRGSPGEALENTLESFARAVQAGADGVELDVQRSADSVPVVIHDPALRRTMGVDGRVARLPWPAIERRSRARVPSLAQVAAWARASGAWLNIEIKATRLEQPVLKIVTELDLRDRVVISSFSWRTIEAVGRLDSGIRRFLLCDRYDEGTLRTVERCGAGGLCLRADAATDAVLGDLRRRDLPVIVWTVNDAAAVQRVFDAGAAAVITDVPAVAVRARDAWATG